MIWAASARVGIVVARVLREGEANSIVGKQGQIAAWLARCFGEVLKGTSPPGSPLWVGPGTRDPVIASAKPEAALDGGNTGILTCGVPDDLPSRNQFRNGAGTRIIAVRQMHEGRTQSQTSRLLMCINSYGPMLRTSKH